MADEDQVELSTKKPAKRERLQAKPDETNQPVAEVPAAPANPGAALSTEKTNPNAYKAGPDDPIMMFPRTVKLNFQGIMYTFAPGPNRVPAIMADHWYLKQNGVTPWKG